MVQMKEERRMWGGRGERESYGEYYRRMGEVMVKRGRGAKERGVK